MTGAAIARSDPRRQYVITGEREQSTVNHSKGKSKQCYKTSLFITCFTNDMHDYIIINYVGSSHYTNSNVELTNPVENLLVGRCSMHIG